MMYTLFVVGQGHLLIGGFAGHRFVTEAQRGLRVRRR